MNVEQEGEVVYKADHKTDEEEFARMREEEEPVVQERELLQVQEPYRPHIRDQPGLPASADPFTTYAGFAVLSVMGIAMLLVKSRKKETAKTN